MYSSNVAVASRRSASLACGITRRMNLGTGRSKSLVMHFRLTKNGHWRRRAGVTIEHRSPSQRNAWEPHNSRMDDATGDHDKPPQKGTVTPTVSALLADGTMVELMFQSEARRTLFAMCSVCSSPFRVPSSRTPPCKFASSKPSKPRWTCSSKPRKQVLLPKSNS